MKRFILTIISSCAMLLAFAQEEIVLDSISKIPNEGVISNLNLIKPVSIEDSFSPEGLYLFEPFRLNQPIFPAFNKKFDFSAYLNNPPVFSDLYLNTGFGFSPFFSTGKIFNQASYRLSDRLLLGGSSFGAQSVFNPLEINSSMQNMNWKGASMFLQYKVSKSVKVEGRVSISNRPNPWEP
jgi:hypothetical protein